MPSPQTAPRIKIANPVVSAPAKVPVYQTIVAQAPTHVVPPYAPPAVPTSAKASYVTNQIASVPAVVPVLTGTPVPPQTAPAIKTIYY